MTPQQNGRPPGRGSGAALGAKVLRLSSIHTIGLFANHALTLVSAIVVAVFLGPAEFGLYGLLLFAVSLLSFVFNLGSKQGTLKRVFGGDDDDDDDDEEEDLADSRQRSLGTGLVLTGLVALVGTGLCVIFAEQVSTFLLGQSTDRDLIVWAGLAGGFGAIVRLASLALWMEHRPIPFVVIETLRPSLALAISVPLLAAGGGLNAAIAGYAIGSAVAALASIYLLGRSIEVSFDLAEVATIMRRGARRVPLVSSMWIVGYMDIFLLSRFVSDTDLGVYHLASKAGFAVAFLPAGYRKALRPLRRTPGFHAVEEEYGAGTARGLQLGYFFLMLIAMLLLVTLLAGALARISPEGYADAAHLVPLLSAGLVAPTVYRMMSKATKFKDKPKFFITGAVCAAALFIGISLVLIPELGIWAPPIAMMVAFAIPAAILVRKGQRGRSPTVMPTRSFALALGSAVLIAGAYYAIDPPGAFLEVLLALIGWGLWGALMFLTPAIPRAHRGPLLEMIRGAAGRSPSGFDEPAVINELPPRERRAGRMAIGAGKSLDRVAARLERDPDELSAQLVGTLRRFAGAAGMPSAEETSNDAEIGRFLFAPMLPADRSAFGKELMKSGRVDPSDLRELEHVAERLRKSGPRAWK